MPMKSYRPKMPHRRKMKPRKTATLKRSGKLWIKADTRSRIFLIAFILLRGLKTLIVLRDLRLKPRDLSS
jgi:hypothetical protein